MPSPVLANIIIHSCSHKSKLKFVNIEADSDSNYIAERTIQYAITSVIIACARTQLKLLKVIEIAYNNNIIISSTHIE